MVEANSKRQYFDAIAHKIAWHTSNANAGFGGGGALLPCGSMCVCVWFFLLWGTNSHIHSDSVNIDSFSVHHTIVGNILIFTTRIDNEDQLILAFVSVRVQCGARARS